MLLPSNDMQEKTASARMSAGVLSLARRFKRTCGMMFSSLPWLEVRQDGLEGSIFEPFPSRDYREVTPSDILFGCGKA